MPTANFPAPKRVPIKERIAEYTQNPDAYAQHQAMGTTGGAAKQRGRQASQIQKMTVAPSINHAATDTFKLSETLKKRVASAAGKRIAERKKVRNTSKSRSRSPISEVGASGLTGKSGATGRSLMAKLTEKSRGQPERSFNFLKTSGGVGAWNSKAGPVKVLNETPAQKLAATFTSNRPKSTLRPKSPGTYKPAVKKSMRAFIAMCQKLIDGGKFEQCKKETERALKAKAYGEIPQDARLFVFCGIANLKTGYLIIAEQMLQKALAFPEVKAEAQAALAKVYKEQGQFTQAVDMYDQTLAADPTHEVAFELGQLLA